MIKSMTGYGRASTKIQIGSCNIEIRSLNSRNLDIKFSGLSLSAELEQKIRSLLSEQIQRGSVKILLTLIIMMLKDLNHLMKQILIQY